jgi:hypothetical protein
VAVGDWNDVNASAQTAMSKNEAAILTWNQTPTEQVFEFKTIRDERGRLVARRDDPAPELGRDAGPIPIRLSCTVGLFGNSSVERSILRAAKQRLEQLSGVDWAPIR